MTPIILLMKLHPFKVWQGRSCLFGQWCRVRRWITTCVCLKFWRRGDALSGWSLYYCCHLASYRGFTSMLWRCIFLVKVWGDLPAELTGLFSGSTAFTFAGPYSSGLVKLERALQAVVDLDKPLLIPLDLKSWITSERLTGDRPGDLARNSDTPLSTEPSISDRERLNPVFELEFKGSLRTGWFAIRLTSSKSSVDDFVLSTKQFQKFVGAVFDLCSS